VTNESKSLRQLSEKRERAALLRQAAEMLSLKDRQQLLADTSGLEAEADRMEAGPLRGE
jgi:hypothetical protein